MPRRFRRLQSQKKITSLSVMVMHRHQQTEFPIFRRLGASIRLSHLRDLISCTKTLALPTYTH